MPTCPSCKAYVRLGEKVCPECGYEADFDAIAERERARRQGVSSEQEAEARRREAQIAAIPVLTIDSVPGRRTEAALGLVSTDIVEYVSGFATAVEALSARLRERAAAELRKQAYQLGGDAVVGVGVSNSMITAAMASVALHLTMIGTAVRLAGAAE